MKRVSKYIMVTGLLGLLTVSSCTKQLDEAYPNPNATVRVPVETLLPSLIGSMIGSSAAAGSAYGMANDNLYLGRYIQYWATYNVSTGVNLGTQFDQMGGVRDGSDLLGSMWAAHYFGLGQNLNRMIEWAGEEQKWDFVGAGYALKAWSTLATSNQYGEMINKEAFNSSLQQFKYDEQEVAYEEARQYAHMAITYLSRTDGNMGQKFAEADFYFNKGDVNRWKKFAYGVLARSFGYLTAKPQYKTAYADSVIKYADLSITSNADNATAKFANTGITGTSSFYGALRANINGSNTGIRQTEFITDLMTGGNPSMFTGVTDPRTPYFLRENNQGSYRGIKPAKGSSGLATDLLPQSFIGTSFSTVGHPSEGGRYIFRSEAEFPVMTASEIQFLKAEAAYLKGDKATALAAYTNAISLNLDMLSTKYSTNIPAGKEITPTSKANYLANPAVVPTAANLTLAHIMTQKYIALFGWGVQETWSDMRKWNYIDNEPNTTLKVYPGFTPPSGTDLHPMNLTKLVYRTRPRYNSEYLYNIPELTRIGAFPTNNDYHTKKPWFVLP